MKSELMDLLYDFLMNLVLLFGKFLLSLTEAFPKVKELMTAFFLGFSENPAAKPNT